MDRVRYEERSERAEPTDEGRVMNRRTLLGTAVSIGLASVAGVGAGQRREVNTRDLTAVLDDLDPERFGLVGADPVFVGRLSPAARGDGFEDAESMWVRYSTEEDVAPGEIPQPKEGPVVDVELTGPMSHDGTTTAFHENALPRSALESPEQVISETVIDGLRDGFRRSLLHDEGRIITDTYLLQSLPGWFLEIHGRGRTIDPDHRPFMRSVASTFRESFIHGTVDVDLASVDPRPHEVHRP